MMIRKKYIYITLMAAALLTACNNEEMPLTLPDGYAEVNFSVGEGLTRAITYVPYDYDRDPHSMGVIGWLNLRTTNSLADNKMFDNLSLTAVYDNDLGTVTWDYSPKRYWINYADYFTFDNFAYMPYNTSTTVTRDEVDNNKYTLTMPVDFGEGNPFSPVETALLCNVPNYKNDAEGIISFKMDQTLSGYQLNFQLDDKMGEIRYFVIKSVKVFGDGFVNNGTVTRDYTWDGDRWTSGDISWTLSNETFDVDSVDAVDIPYHDNSADAPTGKDWTEYYSEVTESVPGGDNVTYGVLRVNTEDVPWGRPIYLFPAIAFNPTFVVTYDAVVVNENGDDVVTRKNVVSSIKFDSKYFEALADDTETEIGKTRSIHVKIKPEHLYVLADADQTFGYITVP